MAKAQTTVGRATRSKQRGLGGELALIDKIRRRAEQAMPPRGAGALALGIGDDCAILRPTPGEDLVVTTDFTLEGRHFRRDWHSPASVGHRTLARGLSDIAAMGARPRACFLSLAVPRQTDAAWIDGFLDGFLGLARAARVPLAGGDSAEAPDGSILADVVLLGSVTAGRALRRSGARPGDRIYVTGALGGAAAELEAASQGTSTPARTRAHNSRKTDDLADSGTRPHFFPQPRLRTGQELVRRGLATAAMDLSDGLSTDVHHLCVASGTAAEIEADKLPLHALLQGYAVDETLAKALHGGEDYELLFTVAPGVEVPRRLGGVPITEIGCMTRLQPRRPRVLLLRAGRREPLEAAGWEHLR